jgi:sec-independent protein translocase protein TatB
MDFLGIGLPELILILIVAVIVVGPRRLPEVAAQLGRIVRQMRGYATDVTSQMRTELDELTKEYEEIRRELDDVKGSAQREVGSVVRQLDKATREPRAIIESSAEERPERRAPARSEPPPDDGREG